jgi:hypothetical protein
MQIWAADKVDELEFALVKARNANKNILPNHGLPASRSTHDTTQTKVDRWSAVSKLVKQMQSLLPLLQWLHFDTLAHGDIVIF